MMYVCFDYLKVLIFFNEYEFIYLWDFVKIVYYNIYEKIGVGSDFLGWVDFFEYYDKEEFVCIKKSVEKIKFDFDVLFVVGIGGFYFGVWVVIEVFNYVFYNILLKVKCGNL